MTASCRWLALSSAWLALTLLPGCALLKSAKQEVLPDSPPPTVILEVDAPSSDIEKLLETHLDLGRLPKLAPGEPIPQPELLRLVAATPAQARDLLETEGYFNPDIDVQRIDGDPPVVRVTVDPGPRAQVVDVRIDVKGPLADHTRAGAPYAQNAQRALRTEWGLPPGSFFRNPEWTSAKNLALSRLRAEGYVSADWANTQAKVDATENQVELAVEADSGPLYRTGELRIEGLDKHDPQVVRNLANFDPGRPATEKLLLDFQERLQRSGLFANATVVLDPTTQDPASTPVIARLGEAPLQQATVGIGVDANVGPRISLEHTHRKVFGWSATARNKIEYARLRQAWEGELSTHTLPKLWRNLVGGALEREESSDDTVTSVRARVGRAQDKPRVSRLIFAEVERSITESPLAREEANAISAHYHGIWRRVDNNLLPTDGYVLSLQAGGGQATSDPGQSGPFVRGYARAVGFWPIGENWYSQARVEVGQVFVKGDVRVPASMRFRAGGDESVRGYAYRSLAPTVDGVVSSGKVLFTSSVEVARPILKRLPALWGAVFVDAGNAADRWSDLDPAVGVGFGVRFRSPVGPLALDLAWGHEVQKLRLHFSVGVTF